MLRLGGTPLASQCNARPHCAPCMPVGRKNGFRLCGPPGCDAGESRGEFGGGVANGGFGESCSPGRQQQQLAGASDDLDGAAESEPRSLAIQSSSTRALALQLRLRREECRSRQLRGGSLSQSRRLTFQVRGPAVPARGPLFPCTNCCSGGTRRTAVDAPELPVQLPGVVQRL